MQIIKKINMNYKLLQGYYDANIILINIHKNEYLLKLWIYTVYPPP